MCDWAYHHEARRKARVLERKRLAEANLHEQACMSNVRPAPSHHRQVDETYNDARSSCKVHRDLEYRVDYPLKHRKVDNTMMDKVAPLLSPPEPTPPPRPQARKPHVKV